MSKLDMLICYNSKSAVALLGRYLGSDQIFNVQYSFDIQSYNLLNKNIKDYQ